MSYLIRRVKAFIHIVRFSSIIFNRMHQNHKIKTIKNIKFQLTSCLKEHIIPLEVFRGGIAHGGVFTASCRQRACLEVEAFGATLIVGPKWCGKTTTAERQAKSILRMQDPDRREGYLATASAKPSLLLRGENPRLIDEWQAAPVLWDAVRTAVDQRQEEGLFILIGSISVDSSKSMHSGTGRISRMKMYPMNLFESKESNGKISLRALFSDLSTDIDGITSDLSIENLIFSACRGGWPAALRRKSDGAKLMIAKDYLNNICESDVSAVDGVQRNPVWTNMILRSYARNISTLAKKTNTIMR